MAVLVALMKFFRAGFDNPAAWYLALFCLSLGATEMTQFAGYELRAQQLITRAEEYIKAHTLAESCHTFSRGAEWRDGIMQLFLWDAEGHCFVCGQNTQKIWDDYSAVKDFLKNELLFTLARQLGKSGGWVDFEQNNVEMHVFIKQIEHQKQAYFLGVGFYNIFGEQQAIRLGHRIYDSMGTNGLVETFTLVSNPYGIFANGGLYGFIIDGHGFYKAHGNKRFVVGQNIFSSDGTWNTFGYAVKKFIDEKVPEGWLDTTSWAGARKMIYGTKYTDKATNELYLLFSAYCPDLSLEDLVNFVKGAISYVKAEGIAVALNEFDKPLGKFDLGSVARIFVYSDAGICLANGENPYVVGQSMMNYQDSRGTKVVRELIEEVLKFGRSLQLRREKNAYKLVYAEKMITPAGKTIIVGSGFWPIAAEQYVAGLIARAQQAVAFYGINYAFEQFVSPQGGAFLRGSSYISVYTMQGICLVRGPHHQNLVWNKMTDITEDGREIFPIIRDIALQGGGWITYTVRGVTHKVLVALQDTTDWGTLILVSGFHT